MKILAKIIKWWKAPFTHGEMVTMELGAMAIGLLSWFWMWWSWVRPNKPDDKAEEE